ncbi:hypothetical protein Tco_0388322 [Tanacetum coccineum]
MCSKYDDVTPSDTYFVQAPSGGVTEARLVAACEQTLSAQKEAGKWKHKYDVALKEAKSDLEKVAAIQDRASKQIQNHEYALGEQFKGTLADMVTHLLFTSYNRI